MATVPWLPGCMTEGDTVEDALVMAREAIMLHVGALAGDGVPIPVERSVPRLECVEVDIDTWVSA
ncbi:MAG TPA: type II toxin-antitoxin system HicB family antitoxin [Thermomicrobiales bacterium]|nr:type II toxin-antitoxin system HicB family antitoxin [Thermomicrobiales bacterium]